MEHLHLNTLNLSNSAFTSFPWKEKSLALTHPVQGAGPGSNTLNRFALICVVSAF